MQKEQKDEINPTLDLLIQKTTAICTLYLSSPYLFLKNTALRSEIKDLYQQLKEKDKKAFQDFLRKQLKKTQGLHYPPHFHRETAELVGGGTLGGTCGFFAAKTCGLTTVGTGAAIILGSAIVATGVLAMTNPTAPKEAVPYLLICKILGLDFRPSHAIIASTPSAKNSADGLRHRKT